jgi:hypothetical protein
MPLGVFIHSITQYSHWCIPTPLAVMSIGCIYISAWGFGVVRFDLQGHSYEPQNVKRAIIQALRFLYIY